MLRRLKIDLMARYAMTDLSEAGLVLGMTVIRDLKRGTLTTSQVNYVMAILERYVMLECNSVYTPGCGPELRVE